MPVTSEAAATWTGSLTEGSGTVAFSSSHLGTFPLDWKARSEAAIAAGETVIIERREGLTFHVRPRP